MVYDGYVSRALSEPVLWGGLSSAGVVTHPGLSSVWGRLHAALPVCTAFFTEGQTPASAARLLKAHYGSITWYRPPLSACLPVLSRLCLGHDFLVIAGWSQEKQHWWIETQKNHTKVGRTLYVLTW